MSFQFSRCCSFDSWQLSIVNSIVCGIETLPDAKIRLVKRMSKRRKDSCGLHALVFNYTYLLYHYSSCRYPWSLGVDWNPSPPTRASAHITSFVVPFSSAAWPGSHDIWQILLHPSGSGSGNRMIPYPANRVHPAIGGLQAWRFHRIA